MRATWKGQLLAESDDTVVVEGNHYFPAGSLRRERFRESATHSVCPWKGTASYYDVVVGGDVNRDAAWYYPEPKPAAANIRGRVAFWKGVQVAALALLLGLGAAPARALENLAGSWAGKMSCDGFDNGVPGHSSGPIQFELDDGGNGSVGFSVPAVGTFFGRVLVDVAHPDRAVVQGAQCGFDEANVDGAVLRGEVRTKAGDVKATLAGTLILLDGPGESSTICEFKLTRVDLQAPTIVCF